MPPSTTHSDSEDDSDYVPPAEDTDTDEHEREVERPTGSVAPSNSVEDTKRQRDALWADFQTSVLTQHVQDAVPRVKVEKTYLFAGEHVREVVEVPIDSDDAKKWPRWSSEGPSSETNAPNPSAPAPAPPTRKSKRPGPRKPRTVLPSIPQASQAKKITTLDKSAIDWRAHVASQSGDVRDQLDANRRGGGYLEKVDFLKRVQERRDDALEASKSSKRRKT